MGMYKYIRNLWKKPYDNMPDLMRERLIAWRRGPSTVRLEKPTRIDRARSIGYIAKKGVIIVRQRVPRGGHKRETIRKGRRPKHNAQRMDLNKNYQRIAEERVEKKYVNCSVVNSYYVAEDGKYLWYEVLLVDRNAPEVLNDKRLKGLAKQRGRAVRGLTSAGRKSRGLRKKGKGAEKIRPSRKANWKRKQRRKN